jgi:arylsulfatase
MKTSQNILFLMTDQQAANTLGCYGNPFVKTPNLDRLAQTGARFDCHLSNSPVCMAARASLLTGRSPEAHGVFRNGYEVREGILPFFSEILQQAGYRTIWNGKHHWKNQMDGVPEPGRYLGFEEHHLTDDNQMGPYFDWICQQGDQYREMVTGTLFNLPPKEHKFWNGRRYISDDEIRTMRKKHIEPRMFGADKSVSYWISPLPDELTQNAWIADRTIDTIRNHKDHSKPFFLSASFVDPHDPYNPTDRFFSELNPKDCPKRRIKVGEHEKSPPHYQKYIRSETEHPWVNRLLRHTEDEWQMLRTCYFAKVNAVDYHIGRILKALEETGLRDSTTIIFTSDHGDMMGDHGMITKGDFHYDSCIRIPLLVKSPEKPEGFVCEKPTTLLDLFPTFLDFAGIEKPKTLLLEGQSLKPVVENQKGFDRDFGCVEIFATVDGTHHPSQWGKTIRNKKWRYTWFPGNKYGQLFDLEADPNEFSNLWGESKYAEIEKSLQNRLFELWMSRCAPLPASIYPV